jgi:hypothetical protein
MIFVEYVSGSLSHVSTVIKIQDGIAYSIDPDFHLSFFYESTSNNLSISSRLL